MVAVTTVGSFAGSVIVAELENVSTVPPPIGSDEAYIKEILKGNADAFSVLFNKYHPRFLGMAMRILRNQAEAEDAVDEAFVDAYRHLSDFQNKAKFSTWLYSIVINHIRNRMRHNRVIRWTSLDGTETVRESGEHRPLDVAEAAPGIDSVVDGKIQMETLYEMVLQLPQPYRTIFSMHYFKGQLLQEIAHELHRPIGTVKAYLHRARKTIERRLKVNHPSMLVS